jgi:hypothetical protein
MYRRRENIPNDTRRNYFPQKIKASKTKSHAYRASSYRDRLGFELWIGDPAEIKAKRVKKQKTDRNDARLLRRLMLEKNFPQIWVPSPENRDLRQLLWHRHRLVQMRTRIMNQLQSLAMNEGYRWKNKLFSEQGRAQLEKLTLAPWASRRRQELWELLDRMNPTIEELTAVDCGGSFYAAAVSDPCRGIGQPGSSRDGFPPRAFSILILWTAFSPLIQGGSRMRRRARTDLCGGRSAMLVPTATNLLLLMGTCLP